MYLNRCPGRISSGLICSQVGLSLLSRSRYQARAGTPRCWETGVVVAAGLGGLGSYVSDKLRRGHNVRKEERVKEAEAASTTES